MRISKRIKDKFKKIFPSSASATSSLHDEVILAIKDSGKKSEKALALLSEVKAQLTASESALIRRTPSPVLEFSVHLVDHCNLKCRGCDHFSPIADEYYLDVCEFERDIIRLSKLYCGQAIRIKLMGGEPLLHPGINEFLPVARKAFPKAQIHIVTNGILLLQKDDVFWTTCKETNTDICITRYPIDIHLEEIKLQAQRFGVRLVFFGNTEQLLKTLYHNPLDIDGKQNPVSNFIKCFHANNCLLLKHGKMYTCTVAPNSEHFNKAFSTELELSDRDSIDIYKAKSAEEISDFLSKPIPFCRYCKVSKRSFGHSWGLSQREIGEWTL